MDRRVKTKICLAVFFYALMISDMQYLFHHEFETSEGFWICVCLFILFGMSALLALWPYQERQ